MGGKNKNYSEMDYEEALSKDHRKFFEIWRIYIKEKIFFGMNCKNTIKSKIFNWNFS